MDKNYLYTISSAESSIIFLLSLKCINVIVHSVGIIETR